MIYKNYNEFYDKAFKSDFAQLWLNGPYPMTQDDYHEMSYTRALKIWVQNNPEAISDRKSLFVEYMKPLLTTMTDGDWAKIKSILPVTSDIPKIMNQRCSIYNEQPQRSWGELDDMMSAIYKNSDFDLQMPDIYTLGKLCGTILINPIFIEGELKLNYLTQDMFRFEVSPDNPYRISKVYYPYQSLVDKDTFGFNIFTDETIQQWSGGRIIREFPNPYGEIPFVWLSLGSHDISNSTLAWVILAWSTTNY